MSKRRKPRQKPKALCKRGCKNNAETPRKEPGFRGNRWKPLCDGFLWLLQVVIALHRIYEEILAKHFPLTINSIIAIIYNLYDLIKSAAVEIWFPWH
jgi:hypothetical protein